MAYWDTEGGGVKPVHGWRSERAPGPTLVATNESSSKCLTWVPLVGHHHSYQAFSLDRGLTNYIYTAIM